LYEVTTSFNFYNVLHFFRNTDKIIGLLSNTIFPNTTQIL